MFDQKNKKENEPVAWLLFAYKGRQYSCTGFAWREESGELVTPYEWDGVRTCGHDYAAVIEEFYPGVIAKEDGDKCDGSGIELINYHILQP